MRRRAPRELGEILTPLSVGLAPTTTLARVQTRWESAVGPAVGAEARPVSESGGVLTVGCQSATWAQELELMSGDLLDRVNDVLSLDSGSRPVQALRFVVGRT